MKFKTCLQDNASILLRAHAKDWKDAIKLGTDLLEKSDAVTTNYYPAIINAIESIGPYIILAPHFAMPHARPEDGVNRTAIALVTLSNPVYFPGESEPVDIFITLAGSSSNEHIALLQEITSVLEDDTSDTGINLDKFRECQCAEDVYQVIDDALLVRG